MSLDTRVFCEPAVVGATTHPNESDQTGEAVAAAMAAQQRAQGEINRRLSAQPTASAPLREPPPSTNREASIQSSVYNLLPQRVQSYFMPPDNAP